MNPIRPSIPPALFAYWKQTAQQLGYGVRGARLKLLQVLLDYTNEHPLSFRRRP